MFKHPFNAIVAGPSGCGKTYFVRTLLCNHHMFVNLNRFRVLWAYGQWQSMYETEKEITYHEGLPDKSLLLKMKPTICVIDDLMTEVASSREMTNMFTRLSHHLGISVIFIAQNIFYKGSEMRTINLNAHYLILFRNPRDE